MIVDITAHDIPGSSARLDHQVAEHVLGWRRGRGGAIFTTDYQSPSWWYDRDGRRQQPGYTDPIANLRAWSPSTHIDDWAMVLVEIRRRQFQVPFLRELAAIADVPIDEIRAESISIVNIWRIFDTSLEVQCIAALRVVGVEL